MADKTKVALVGIGKIALDQHVPALAASPDFTLAATVSRRGQQSNQFKPDTATAAGDEIGIHRLMIGVPGEEPGPSAVVLLGGGPGWDRTSDLPRVKRTLSH